MTYEVRVPFEVTAPLDESDSDVRSIARLPGFVRLEAADRDRMRYELTLDVEGGSLRDAGDAAEELIAEYVDALGAYRPRMLATIAPELR
jgi:hypothetical protein